MTSAGPATTASNTASFLDHDKALACIHCGLCLSSCPTYLETGNENDSPRGRIHLMRAVQDGRLSLGDSVVRHVDLCLGCRACEAVCPSGVQYGQLLEGTRDHIGKHHERSPWQSFLRRVAIERVLPFPERMELALVPAQVLLEVALQAESARVFYLARATLAVPFGPDCAFPSEAKTERIRSADRVVGVSEYVARYFRQHAGIDAVHVPISLLEPEEWPAGGNQLLRDRKRSRPRG